MKEEIVKETEEQEKKGKKHIFRNTILIIFFLCLLFYLYIHFVEPNMLIVKEQAIVDNNLPYSFHGTKIIQFSDILYGTNIEKKNLKKVVEKINHLKPDIVIFTGDLLNSTIKLNEKNKNDLKEILGSIHATFKKYAVMGDNDFSDSNTYFEIMESAEFMILNNKNDFLYYKGNDPIMFIGTSSLLEKEQNIELAMTTTEDTNSIYKIWIHHEPTILAEFTKKDIYPNLIFTGHTLNGLVTLPLYGSILKQEGVKEYTKNYYQIEDSQMYISGGLGTYKVQARFLNFPSINLYRLYQY